MNLITEPAAGAAAGHQRDVGRIEFADMRWRWTIKVSETAVESMRRIDVRVRQADAPDDSSLANLTVLRHGDRAGGNRSFSLDTPPRGEGTRDEGSDAGNGDGDANPAPPAILARARARARAIG